MPQITHIQTNFTGGELSPRLVGRADLQKYNNSCETLENFITQKHGGLVRRTGSRFVATTKTQSEASRLIPFQFSVLQTYILEFGDLYVRFYRDKGRLQHGTVFSVSDAEWTNLGGGVATITLTADHDFQIGDTISVHGITSDSNQAINQLLFNEGTPFAVTGIPAANQFTYALPRDPLRAGLDDYDSGGTCVRVSGSNLDVPLELVTPYLASELRDIKFVQSADILYLVHPLHPPQRLQRLVGNDADPVTWTFTEFEVLDGPYLPQNTTGQNFSITNLGDGLGIGAEVGIAIPTQTVFNGGRGFLSTDVGRKLSLQKTPSVNWIWLIISQVIDQGSARGIMQESASVDFMTTAWRAGSWSDTTGFPHTLAFHKSRLWFGATNTQPQTLWASRVGAFNEFEDFLRSQNEDVGIVLDDHALVFTIDDDKVNTIRWIESEARGMAILTNGGTFIGAAPNTFDPITPINFTVLRQISDGASQTAQPHQAGEVILFVKSASRKVLELVFRFEDDRFVAPDLTILAEHITLSGIVETAYQTEPDNILWCVLNNGLLIGMTYERPEKVVAWHRHPVGGSLATEPHPAVESVAVIRDEPDDLLWMIVKRTASPAIGNQVRRFVEYVDPPHKDDQTNEDAFYVDAGGTFTGANVAISRLLFFNQIQTLTPHNLVNGQRVHFRGLQFSTDLGTGSRLNDQTFLVTFSEANPVLFTITRLDGSAVTITDTHVQNTGRHYNETDEVGGLSHLEGDTVTILADGAPQENQTVTIGKVSIDPQASIIHVGLPFKSRMKTMPLIPKAPFDPRGMTMRVDHALLYLNRSLGGQAGDDHKLDPIVVRLPSKPAGVATPLFTGVYKVAVSQRADEQVQIVVETQEPMPLNILQIVSKMQVDDI